MNALMSGANALGNSQSMETELFSQYTVAVYEAVSYAAIAALIAALLASFFISRQVVTPMLGMMSLSHRIAKVNTKKDYLYQVGKRRGRPMSWDNWHSVSIRWQINWKRQKPCVAI